MDYFLLTRTFWDFAFENPEKIKPTHIAVYFFAVEHCNRLGWKVKFGLPTSMVLDAIGIKSYSVYKKTFDDLVDFGFIEVIEYSKNQYSSNIIALKENSKAHSKALDKALIKHVSKHTPKQCQSTYQSTESIDKQYTNIPLNNKQETDIPAFDEFFIYAKEKEPNINKTVLKLKYDSWIVNDWKDGNNNKIKNWKQKILNTLPYINKNTSTTNSMYNSNGTIRGVL